MAALFVGFPFILAGSIALVAAHESDVEPIILLGIYYAIAISAYALSYLILALMLRALLHLHQ
jgi:hypothetical protein